MKYLSPTSINLFYKDNSEFYKRYICRSTRPQQTQPMSIGSAFDAYVKAHLSGDPLDASGIEPHNMEWAMGEGLRAFDIYKKSGALGSLELELSESISPPHFEKAITGVIGGVVFLGHPDLFYINKEGTFIILDWKVNGWCSKWGASPIRYHMDHKDVMLCRWKGEIIDVGHNLEDANTGWADQLAIYAWLCGAEREFVTCIEQLACKPGKVRVIHHRSRVGVAYQDELLLRAQHVWEVVHSPHFFRDLSLQDSVVKGMELKRKAASIDALRSEDPEFLRITGEL